MPNNPKRHHIVPQSYLNRFSVSNSSDKVFCLIKNDDGTFYIPPKPTNTENVCVESNFYSRIADNRPNDTGIEKLLAVFEHDITDSVLNGISPNTKHPYNAGGIALSPKERLNIIATITIQILRGKATRKLVSESITSSVYMNTLAEAKNSFPDNLLTRKGIKYIEDHEREIKNNAIVEGSVLETLKDFSKSRIFKSLETRNCFFIVNTTSTPFITSDEPVLIRDGSPNQHHAYSCALDNPFSQVYYPIDPTHMIALYSKYMSNNVVCDYGIVALLTDDDINLIKHLNAEQYHQSSRFVIASDKDSLEEIASSNI